MSTKIILITMIGVALLAIKGFFWSLTQINEMVRAGESTPDASRFYAGVALACALLIATPFIIATTRR